MSFLALLLVSIIIFYILFLYLYDNVSVFVGHTLKMSPCRNVCNYSYLNDIFYRIIDIFVMSLPVCPGVTKTQEFELNAKISC